MVLTAVVFADIVDLGMAIVAGRNAIIRPRMINLLEFQPTVRATRFKKTGL